MQQFAVSKAMHSNVSPSIFVHWTSGHIPQSLPSNPNVIPVFIGEETSTSPGRSHRNESHLRHIDPGKSETPKSLPATTSSDWNQRSCFFSLIKFIQAFSAIAKPKAVEWTWGWAIREQRSHSFTNFYPSANKSCVIRDVGIWTAQSRIKGTFDLRGRRHFMEFPVELNRDAVMMMLWTSMKWNEMRRVRPLCHISQPPLTVGNKKDWQKCGHLQSNHPVSLFHSTRMGVILRGTPTHARPWGDETWADSPGNGHSDHKNYMLLW